MASSALLNSIRQHVVAKKACDPYVEILKSTVAEIVSDPAKFNEYPKLAYIMHKSKFDIDNLTPESMDFSHLKSYKEDLQSLSTELGIGDSELTFCITANEPEKLFYSAMKNNENFVNYRCIHERADHSSDGSSEIIYKVDCDNIISIMFGCDGIPDDYEMSGC